MAETSTNGEKRTLSFTWTEIGVFALLVAGSVQIGLVLGALTDVRSQVDDIRQHGSPVVQSMAVQIANLETRITAVEKATGTVVPQLTINDARQSANIDQLRSDMDRVLLWLHTGQSKPMPSP